MKIFQIITASEYGGAQTVVTSLIKSLSPQHELFVLYGGNGEAFDSLDANFTKIKLGNHNKEISWRDIGVFFKLLYYRFKYNPDIVHLHSSKMGVLGRLAFPKRKIVLTMHGFDSVRKAHKEFLRIEQLMKNRAHYIVGVGQYDVDVLAKEGIENNVIRICNGISDEYQRHVNIDNNITRELKRIKEEYPKLVLCISRISKQKKFDLFLEVAMQMPRYAFVWVGNKQTMNGLPPNVYCLGEMQSAYHCLVYADVFILPTNYEGLPVSILEALSFKVPVVASAVGGITEVLDGKNGFAVENNAEAFKEKIEYIFSDNEIQKNMSEYARQSYLTNFTVEKMVEAYKAIFNAIVTKT